MKRESGVDRWDREWLQYLCTEDPSAHLRSYAQLGGEVLDPERVRAMSAVEILDFAPITGGGSWFVWADGASLVGRDVGEFGCGCGFLGKQISQISRSYTGFDVSRLALRIAQLVSPETCSYVHVDDLSGWPAESLDIVVGRHFFIHLNRKRLRDVLLSARRLLRAGGEVRADFWCSPPRRASGTVLSPGADDAEAAPSAAYEYELREIQEIAGACGFEVAGSERMPSVQRTFVKLVRH